VTAESRPDAAPAEGAVRSGDAAPAPDVGPPPAATPAFRVAGLVHVYPEGTRALDGVDLTVRPGELVAIVGQNGSGKSTLVRHLNGLLRPTDGRVEIQGDDATGLRTAALARRVGLAFQDPDRQIFAGRVRAEVAFGPRNLGLRGAALDAAVRGSLDAVGLGDQLDTNPYDLGYSRRKLLAIASVLAMGTPIVVLDEPTTGQDLRGIARVRALIERLSGEGRTVVAISHDMRFVAETFRRIVVMRMGRIILDGTPAEVFAEANWPAFATTYLEPPLAARVGARLGLGGTPTEGALVEALAARG
jgi:energy-coupling factor transport system ATP-binding protein